MRKFPSIRYPNDPETDGLNAGDVVVTEKLDGANFRFAFEDDGDTLRIGTRNHAYEVPDENIPKAFRHAVEWCQNLEPLVKTSMADAGVFFGEAMHLHSIEYDVAYETPNKGSPHFKHEPSVVLFDWWQDEDFGWADWRTFEDFTDEFGLPTTQVLERGDPEDLSFDIPEESMFGAPPEGIVARRIDGTVRAKKVTDDFRETNATSFNDASKAQTDAGEFVATYITDARVMNVAHRLRNEGPYDDIVMDMMEDLPREVLKDAMAENGWDLLTSGSIEVEWDDDFKHEVRSKASKKCARVLKMELQQF